MADPTKYKPHFNYSGWEAAGSKRPKPGAELDTDFANIERSIDETIDALKDIRRSDGKLKNGIVDKDALDESARELWESAEVAAEDAKGSAQLAAGAAASASTSAELARGYASDAVSQGNVPIYASAVTVQGLEIPAGITAFRTNGETTPGDGKGSLYVESDASSGTLQSGDGRWWAEAPVRDHATFSTVADVQNSHIPAVLDSIRTLGYGEPGVGDANYRRMLVSEVDQPGQIVAADGSRWALVGPEITAEACGALADGSDDAEALQVAAAAAVAADATLVLSVGKTYTFSQLVIPAGCKIRAAGAKLRYLGGLPEQDDISIRFEPGCEIDHITYLTPGTESNAYALYFEDDVKVGSITGIADQQKGGSFIEVAGNNVRIGTIHVKNADRPVHVGRTDGTVTRGSYIGFLEAENYIRGIRYTNHSNFILGGHYFHGRSPNADPNTLAPGQNGILIAGAQDFFIASGRVDDAAEHAYRLGGSSAQRSNLRGTFGDLFAFRPRGSAFKINTDGDPILSEDIAVSSITAVDCGEGEASGGGGAPDFIRLTNVRRVRIGHASCHASGQDFACRFGVTLNNSSDVSIGHLHLDKAKGAAFTIDDAIDAPAGPVRRVHIGGLSGTALGGGLVSFNTAEDIGDIFLHNVNASGYTDRLLGFFGAPSVVGPIHIEATTRGPTPIIVGAPERDDVTLDLTYEGHRYYGPMYRYRNRGGALQVTGDPLDSSSATPTGLFLNSYHAPEGNGNYGVGVEFSRLGTTRRGAAISSKQTSENAGQQGLAFFVKPSTTASSDSLSEVMVLDHQGNLSVIGALSKGSGTFCIDHPLDPHNRDLVHGFVEAPEYGLIYRGRVSLQNGTAEVDIDADCGMEPGTFAALTQMADVHALTNRTGFGRLRASEIVDGKFTIEAEDGGDDEVAWMVYAARADDFIRESAPWVDENGRLVPSQEKPSELLGLRRHGGHAEEADDDQDG